MWRDYFADYDGYRDHATKETLQRLDEGLPPEEAGSTSTDLGGATRIAPLVYQYHADEDALVAAARHQTVLTHRNADVIDSAAFFARLAAIVLAGQEPRQALQVVLQRHYDRPPFDNWVARGFDSREMTTREAIGQFGRACDVAAAFPGVIHLIAKYQDDPRNGLIENVMAGGDSAARGLIAGMIFGAFSGMDAVVPDWVNNLTNIRTIESLLDQLVPAQ
jgi:ADP-ribosylglycohydrolase